MNKIILHLDMNSYFASVEQQANPFLRGKPLGVCAYLSPNGCIIASSIEAKAVGIGTGTRVRDALKKYPRINLLENEPSKYRAVTKHILSIIADYSDRIEPYSIDETFLDLTGWARDFRQAEKIAEEIRWRIKNEIGQWLCCSIGISYTRWLAKFASDIVEKNGLLILTPDKLESTYAGVDMKSAWGINYATERRLNALGIYTLNELRKFPISHLRQSLGLYGYHLWANVNGIHTEPVKNDDERLPKSIGHSYCIPRQTTHRDYLRTVMIKLCEKAGRRLRAQKLEASRIAVGLSYVIGGGRHKHKRLTESLFDTMSIFYYANKFLFSEPLLDRARLLYVSVSGLHPLSYQRSFLSNQHRVRKLALALDTINDKYGDFTVYSGQMMNTSKLAQDRIGFRKTLAVKQKSENVSYISDEY